MSRSVIFRWAPAIVGAALAVVGTVGAVLSAPRSDWYAYAPGSGEVYRPAMSAVTTWVVVAVLGAVVAIGWSVFLLVRRGRTLHRMPRE